MITVLADDITGAAEIAGICLHYGLQIRFDFDSGLEHVPDADVWIIASDTRSMSEAEAREKVSKIAHFLACHCWPDPQSFPVFKKIDSALRGHIIPEIEALLKHIPKKQTYILPANPENGRIIRDGMYYINKQPLNETSFGDDPDFPAHTSLVKEIIHLQDNEKYILPDIVSEKDYIDYANLNSDILPVGASAFFDVYLQTIYPLAGKIKQAKNPELGKYRLMICGSTHETSQDFIRKMNSYFIVEITINEIDSLLDNLDLFEKRMKNYIEIFNRHKRLIVCIERRKANPITSGKIKHLLAAISKYMLENTHIEELFIEGGATAYACLQANGFSSLIPVHEYTRGVVRLEIPARENLYITIKPGSYSWPEELIL